MKKFLVLLTLLCWAATVLGADDRKLNPMPVAVSGNAVASLRDGLDIFSMMGVGPRKTWDDVTSKLYIFHLANGRWSEGHPVPGVVGRLNAAAAGAKGREVVLMGGFVPDAQGGELTVSDVNVLDVSRHQWTRGKDLPVPVDSAVVGVNHDRFVYLIGGRSPSGPVNNVQVYDAEKDSWSQATPLPGTPVFGLAGGLADGNIVVIDGAKAGPAGGPRYVASDECWLGKIDHKDPNKIEWSKLPPHPGPARFGIAGGGSNRDKRVFFSGGTSTPHDYQGVSYDGKPPEISLYTFAFELHGHKWETISQASFDPRGDSRAIVTTPIGELIVGGMVKNMAVTVRVTPLPEK